MRIIEEEQLDFEDLMLMPQHSDMNSRSEVVLERDFKYVGNDGRHYVFRCIPIVASNMIGIGCPSMAKVLAKNKCMCALEKHCSHKQVVRLASDIKHMFISDESITYQDAMSHPWSTYVLPTIGIKEPFDMLQALYDEIHFMSLVIDVPNAYIPNAVARVKEAASRFPDAFIIAGNVVTSEQTYALLEAGAHCVKTGIGNGSCCLTRKLTNCGRPQASAVMDCANAAHNLHKYVMSDGGCKNEGHIATAFCCGADFVMSGSMFMGCDEMESEVVEKDGKKFKIAMGSSSRRAQDMMFGGMAKYRASEGREVLVPCKGPLQDVLDSIFGGLRSCGTYIGAHQLKDFNKHANFYKVRRTLNTMLAGCESIA